MIQKNYKKKVKNKFMFKIIISLSTILLIYKYFSKKIRNFKDKKILIIGGSSGLGLSLGLQLSELGSNVTITGRNKKKLENIRKYSFLNVLYFDSDEKNINFNKIFGNEKDDESKRTYDKNAKVEENYDIIYYCAGTCIPGYFNDLNIDTYVSQINTNLIGALKSLKYFKNHNKKPFEFILIGSTLSVTSIPGYSAYKISKSGLKALFDSLYLELKKHNIKLKIFLACNILTPGFINENKIKPKFTKRIDNLGFVVNVDEMAKKIIKDNLDVGVSDFFTEMMLIGNEIWSLKQIFLIPVSFLVCNFWKFWLEKMYMSD